ncbi:tubulin polyglutamylase [Thraustotheca clavata]|uniref:Tubulin--tyrosine ligase-like protein 5 n=1 Tax=Thraustotheca clavata TaxID=74557 RepID=A0A1W0A8L2_9STRA|nr:tubulin polyglutamylase [Thraustotheca clavata]
METRLGLRDRLELSRLKLEKQALDTVDLDKPEACEDDDSFGSEEDAEGEDLVEDVDDDEVVAPQPPSTQNRTQMKIQFSRFPNRIPTICFDYPSDLQVSRQHSPGINTTEISSETNPVFFKCYWERNCVKNAFVRAGFCRLLKGKKWTAAWIKHMPRTSFKSIQAHQKVNHFPDPWIIGRKDRLMKTINSMKRKFASAYSFAPEGFLLPSQMDAFQRCLDRESGPSMWIFKPPASACGRGIRVIHSTQLETFLKSKNRKWVVQRYLSSPYLIDGFKFDLRIYVVVTCFDPLRIYLFQEGLARFCTVKYSTQPSHLKNRLMHLTNYSVNKKNDTFKASSTPAAMDGSKWSFTALLAYLQKQGKDITLLQHKIRDIICKTIIAAESHITPLTQTYVKHRHACYELFGFDMMLDSSLEPWLIEVNVSPSLMGSSPLDKRIKGLLMSDIFHLVGHNVPPQLIPEGSNNSTSANADKKKVGKPPSTSRKLFDIVQDYKITAFEPGHLALFCEDDWDIVYSMEEEMDRLGHFQRIYPDESSGEDRYASYFSCARYANRLCQKWLQTKRKKEVQKKAGYNVLQTRVIPNKSKKSL